MRSAFQALARMALLCALVIPEISGCSKKVTAPANGRPLPEGQQDGQLLMLGWHEQASVSFVVTDPGTPDNPSDDALASVGLDRWADLAGVRTATLDASVANQMQAFRIGTDGTRQPMFDFMIQPRLRFIGRGADLFEFEDFSPGAAPSYVGRGALDGVVTTQSPVSNLAGATATCDDNMNFIPQPKLAPGDSVLRIQYVDDPRAVFDVIEIGSAGSVLGTGSSFSDERRIRGIPSPFLPGLRPLSALTLLLPAGAGYPGLAFRISSITWPLFFYIRVTAFDSKGRMVNRVNDYLLTRATASGLGLAVYEPMGGAVEVLDPYPDFKHPVPTPIVVDRDAAFAILNSFGGIGRPNQMSALSGSAASGTHIEPETPEMAQAMTQILAHPMFSAQALRQNIATVRRAMEQPSPGSSTVGATRTRAPATGRAGH